MRAVRRSRRSAAGLVGLVLAACVAGAPTDARADGWKIQLQGGKALGASYAGRSVLTEDASVVWFNPAGLTELRPRTTITLGAPVITYQLVFRDAQSTSLLGQPLRGATTADGGTTAAVPHFYVAAPVTQRWRVGLGVNVPYGLGTNYDESWVGRYHATETQLSVLNVNPAVAVRLTDDLSVGGGLDIQHSTATLSNMIDFGSIGSLFALPLAPQGHDGRVEFTGTDWAAGWNAGVLWTPSAATRLGAAFRSRIDHRLQGTADFTVPAEASLLTDGGRLFSDGRAEVVLPMPTEFSVSGSHRLSRDWTLLGDLTWTDWSVFKELRVAFDSPFQPPVRQDASWNDSLRGAVGLRGQITPQWLVSVGAAYETTPVPEATRTPRLPERPHTWISGSATYTAGSRWTFDVHASHLITSDAPLRVADPSAGLLVGSVHWRLTVVGLSATVAF